MYIIFLRREGSSPPLSLPPCNPFYYMESFFISSVLWALVICGKFEDLMCG